VRAYNNYLSPQAIPVSQALSVTTCTTLMFLVIVYGHEMPRPFLIFCVTGFLAAFMIITVAIRIAGFVHRNSVEFLQVIRGGTIHHHDGSVNMKYIRCKINSLAQLKIMTGSVNFLEVSTCLIMLGLVFDNLANMLVAYNKSSA